MEILICKNLKKQVKHKVIVEHISFSINKGDVVGFIGPNGAGKTTTIKLILGLIKLTEGKVYINGYDIQKNYIKAIEKVGAIVENPDAYLYLSGYDNLRIVANNYKNIGRKRIDEVAKIVGLENRIKDKVSTYSLGMRQRLGIAAALINSPELLILDEPTNGLDIEGVIEIRTLIKQLSHQGIAIMISSHNLTEIDHLCNRIIAIKKGKIVTDDSLENFKTVSHQMTYILELNRTDQLDQVLTKEKYDIIDQGKIRIYVTKNEISSIMQKLMENQYQIFSMQEEKLTSEQAFIQKVGENEID